MNRRSLLKIGATTAASLVAMNAIAAQEVCKKALTAKQAEGPFYPIVDQADTDADLIFVNGSRTQAKGQIVFIQGQVTDQRCNVAEGVLVEIWQACHTGKYNHPSDPNTAELDPNFQYWGKAVTDKNGNYKFRTIVPAAYPAGDGWIRPPHIHFKIAKLGYKELITQMYFTGNDDLNRKDLILAQLSAEQQRDVTVELKEVAGSAHPVGVFNIQIEKLRP